MKQSRISLSGWESGVEKGNILPFGWWKGLVNSPEGVSSAPGGKICVLFQVQPAGWAPAGSRDKRRISLARRNSDE